MTTDPHDAPRPDEFRLSPDDATALDALVDQAWRVESLPADVRARGARLMDLLALAGESRVPAPESPELIDVTLARILRARRDEDAVLSPEDEDALDAFVTERFQAERVASALRPRAERLARIGAMVTSPVSTSGGAPADLAERTLRHIPVRVRRQDRATRLSLGSFRMTDLVSVAATLLICASVLIPLVSTVRAQQTRGSCGANFASLAGAFGTYSGDYRDQLPMAAAGLGGPTWWEVGAGPGRSNSANLFRLPKLRYTTLSTMRCPTNGEAPTGPCAAGAEDWSCLSEVSYSYQNMFGERRPRWKMGPGLVILGDASPVIRGAIQGVAWVPNQNSTNHGGRGQWVLRNDGSGAWVTSPVVDGDNIWLTTPMQLAEQAAIELGRRGIRSGIIEIRGREFPSSETDSFLTP